MDLYGGSIESGEDSDVALAKTAISRVRVLESQQP